MIDSRIKQCFNWVEREEYTKAWPQVAEMLNDHPDQPQLLYLAGCIMRQMGHVGIALQLFRRALARERKIPNIWMHFGSCLHDTHQYDDAREAFLHVHKTLPQDAQPPANIAAGYVQQGKAREAVEWADKALALADANPIARIARAFGNLSLGRWAEGWKDSAYLYGDKLTIRVYNPPEREEPTWDGSKGQTVVVQADQGLGDMIMFAQCLPELVRDCKKVIVETNTRLAPLFRRNWPAIDVYDTLDTKGGLTWPRKYQIDAHVHISWLGTYYRKIDADFPRVPYITADPEKAQKWRAWLEQFPKPWIGVAWRGGIPRTNHLARSIKLEELAPVFKRGGSFINLAYQDVGLEIARWNIDNREQVHVPNLDNDGDYDETVALISELDHVVTVTTTVAHVCGALGKKASVLVNAQPAWRYGYDNDGIVWYPRDSVKLYRQAKGEKDWQHAIARLARDYGAFVVPLAEAA